MIIHLHPFHLLIITDVLTYYAFCVRNALWSAELVGHARPNLSLHTILPKLIFNTLTGFHQSYTFFLQNGAITNPRHTNTRQTVKGYNKRLIQETPDTTNPNYRHLLCMIWGLFCLLFAMSNISLCSVCLSRVGYGTAIENVHPIVTWLRSGAPLRLLCLCPFLTHFVT